MGAQLTELLIGGFNHHHPLGISWPNEYRTGLWEFWQFLEEMA